MRFLPKKDLWLTMLIAFVCTMLILAGATSHEPLAPLFSLIPGALLLWIYFGTHYDLEEHSLVVRHGPLRWTIHYDDITDVRLVRNVWSSAALSIDRVCVVSRRVSLHISPLDRETFVVEVNKRRRK